MNTKQTICEINTKYITWEIKPAYTLCEFNSRCTILETNTNKPKKRHYFGWFQKNLLIAIRFAFVFLCL